MMGNATARHASAVRHSVAIGLAFLQAKQRNDGAWVDFELEVGQATAWTTAFVVGLLRTIDPTSALRGVRWLLSTARPDAGWGYNERVPTDCDSTAWSILALADCCVMHDEASVDLLRQFRASDGLYRTFRPDSAMGHWASPHLDVSCIAVRALLTRVPDDIEEITAGVDALVRTGLRDGWHSYWWDDSVYCPSQALITLSRFKAWSCEEGRRRSRTDIAMHQAADQACDDLLKELRSGTRNDGALQLSLRLSAIVEVDSTVDEAAALARNLVALQRDDGSWPPSARLRVTNRDVARPWLEDNPGPVFDDCYGILTTAAAVGSLIAWQRSMSPSRLSLTR